MERILSVKPWVVGVAVFLFTAIGLGQLTGPTTCRDGWRSSSIGRQGACSHHGGVDRSKGQGIMSLSLLAAIAGGFAWARFQRGKPTVPTGTFVLGSRRREQMFEPYNSIETAHTAPMQPRIPVVRSVYEVTIADNAEPDKLITQQVEATSELHATGIVMTAQIVERRSCRVVGCERLREVEPDVGPAQQLKCSPTEQS